MATVLQTVTRAAFTSRGVGLDASSIDDEDNVKLLEQTRIDSARELRDRMQVERRERVRNNAPARERNIVAPFEEMFISPFVRCNGNSFSRQRLAQR